MPEADHLRDTGRYFSKAEHVSLPPEVEFGDPATALAWFIWLSGEGNLMSTEDDTWAIGFDSDGFLAYRMAGVERVTPMPIEDFQDSWHLVAMNKAGGDVSLRVDDAVLDQWAEAPITAPIGGWSAMRGDVEGFAADFAVLERRLSDASLDQLWLAGRGRV
jgi:hypothetical protein